MRTPTRLIAAGFLAAGLLLGTAGMASADAVANGSVSDSPGFLSGNLIQVPIDAPINICGNSVNVVGALNPAHGNRCENGEGESGDDAVVAHHTVWHHWWWHHDDDDNNATDDHGSDQDCG